MLLGQPDDGLKSFEATLSKNEQSLDLQINVLAARLTAGDVDGA